jgi:hypothetical protein
MYLDDLADQISNYLHNNWLVSSTGCGNSWHEVEISYDLGPQESLIFPSILTIKLTKTGHIDWQQVKKDCAKINSQFFNKEKIELLKQYE